MIQINTNKLKRERERATQNTHTQLTHTQHNTTSQPTSVRSVGEYTNTKKPHVEKATRAAVIQCFLDVSYVLRYVVLMWEIILYDCVESLTLPLRYVAGLFLFCLCVFEARVRSTDTIHNNNNQLQQYTNKSAF